MLNINNLNNFFALASRLRQGIVSYSAVLGNNWQPWTFIALSMLVQISIGQEENIETNSLKYWLLIGPALILPAFHFKQILGTLIMPRGRLLLAFGAIAGAWHLFRGDIHAVTQLALLIWITGWVASLRIALSIESLVKLYTYLVCIGILIAMFTDMNVWGIVPANTREDYGIWRVSFFPNIANTGIMSLFVVLILTRDKATMRQHPIALAIALYFLIFSFVRAVQIAALLYLAMRFWLDHMRPVHKLRQVLFVGTIGFTVVIHILIAISPLLLEFAQQFSFISRLFLRGAANLTPQEIFAQAYRPWLWEQHIYQFISSPGWMGLGSFEFSQAIDQSLLVEHIDKGSESLPTRLLASYGFAAFFFIGFIITNLKRKTYAHDHWACACFPAVFVLLMNWGSVFHPSNAFFILFFFILIHGSAGFSHRATEPCTLPLPHQA